VVDGEEEAELQGATASVLLLGLGSCVDGIGLDAMRDREETGGAMACCSELAGRLHFHLYTYIRKSITFIILCLDY